MLAKNKYYDHRQWQQQLTTIHRKLDFANPIYVRSILRDSPDREFTGSVSMPLEPLWAEHQTQLAITP